jgi:AraC-like DNA-binding protein
MTAVNQRHVKVIAEVTQILDTHYGDRPSLSQLAARVGLSRSHLSRTFHAVVGVTMRRYVNELRLQHACGLLTRSTLSLTAIANECGFYDLSHFDKSFRRRFRTSPGEFRISAATSPGTQGMAADTGTAA